MKSAACKGVRITGTEGKMGGWRNQVCITLESCVLAFLAFALLHAIKWLHGQTTPLLNTTKAKRHELCIENVTHSCSIKEIIRHASI